MIANPRLQIVHIYVEEDSRIKGWGSTPENNTIPIEVSEDHELLRNPFIFKYEDGKLIKDEAYQQQLIEEQNKPTQFELLQGQVIDTQVALVESFETTLKAQEDTTNTQLALTDVYELVLEMQTKMEELTNKVAELESKQ